MPDTPTGPHRVFGDEYERLQFRLRCEHPIEWLFVFGGIAAGSDLMVMGYQQMVKTVACHQIVETRDRSLIRCQPAQPNLNDAALFICGR